MKLVRRFAVPLVVVAVLVVTAVNCVGWLPINDRPCPCTHGWTCSVDTCVPDGYPPDGGTADAQFPSADAPFPSDGGGAPDVHPFPSDGGGAPDANPFPSDGGGVPDANPFPSDGGGVPDANPFPSDAGRR